jgi:hypothetical protein
MRNDLHFRGPGFEVRAIGSFAVAVAATLIALSILLAAAVRFF